MRRHARGPITAALLASALLAAGCGSGDGTDGGAAEPGAMEIALQDDAVLLYRNYYDRDRALRQARELGVARIKAGVPWARVLGDQAQAPEPPRRARYDWSRVDSLIDAAARAGIRVQLGLMGPAPAWASGDGAVSPREPDAKRFADFAGAAASHFRGRVDSYSIWNEPNHKGWLAPQSKAPRLYRELYEAGSRAIKRADPKPRVLIGETAPYEQPGRTTAPLEFLREVLCLDSRYRPTRSCEPLRADGYAHHPYDFANPPDRPYPGRDNVTIGSLGRLIAALDAVARAKALVRPDGKPLDVYLTEFGYFASGPLALPPPRRARYLSAAFERASRSRRVREMLQYLLVAPPPEAPGGRFNTALLTQDGRADEAYRALRAWSRRAREAGRAVGPEDGALELEAPSG
jgi:Cellulase (glycosyl hydrolase family 5)